MSERNRQHRRRENDDHPHHGTAYYHHHPSSNRGLGWRADHYHPHYNDYGDQRYWYDSEARHQYRPDYDQQTRQLLHSSRVDEAKEEGEEDSVGGGERRQWHSPREWFRSNRGYNLDQEQTGGAAAAALRNSTTQDRSQQSQRSSPYLQPPFQKQQARGGGSSFCRPSTPSGNHRGPSSFTRSPLVSRGYHRSPRPHPPAAVVQENKLDAQAASKESNSHSQPKEQTMRPSSKPSSRQKQNDNQVRESVYAARHKDGVVAKAQQSPARQRSPFRSATSSANSPTLPRNQDDNEATVPKSGVEGENHHPRKRATNDPEIARDGMIASDTCPPPKKPKLFISRDKVAQSAALCDRSATSNKRSGSRGGEADEALATLKKTALDDTTPLAQENPEVICLQSLTPAVQVALMDVLKNASNPCDKCQAVALALPTALNEVARIRGTPPEITQEQPPTALAESTESSPIASGLSSLELSPRVSEAASNTLNGPTTVMDELRANCSLPKKLNLPLKKRHKGHLRNYDKFQQDGSVCPAPALQNGSQTETITFRVLAATPNGLRTSDASAAVPTLDTLRDAQGRTDTTASCPIHLNVRKAIRVSDEPNTDQGKQTAAAPLASATNDATSTSKYGQEVDHRGGRDAVAPHKYERTAEQAKQAAPDPCATETGTTTTKTSKQLRIDSATSQSQQMEHAGNNAVPPHERATEHEQQNAPEQPADTMQPSTSKNTHSDFYGGRLQQVERGGSESATPSDGAGAKTDQALAQRGPTPISSPSSSLLDQFRAIVDKTPVTVQVGSPTLSCSDEPVGPGTVLVVPELLCSVSNMTVYHDVSNELQRVASNGESVWLFQPQLSADSPPTLLPDTGEPRDGVALPHVLQMIMHRVKEYFRLDDIMKMCVHYPDSLDQTTVSFEWRNYQGEPATVRVVASFGDSCELLVLRNNDLLGANLVLRQRNGGATLVGGDFQMVLDETHRVGDDQVERRTVSVVLFGKPCDSGTADAAAEEAEESDGVVINSNTPGLNQLNGGSITKSVVMVKQEDLDSEAKGCC